MNGEPADVKPRGLPCSLRNSAALVSNRTPLPQTNKSMLRPLAQLDHQAGSLGTVFCAVVVFRRRVAGVRSQEPGVSTRKEARKVVLWISAIAEPGAPRHCRAWGPRHRRAWGPRHRRTWGPRAPGQAGNT